MVSQSGAGDAKKNNKKNTPLVLDAMKVTQPSVDVKFKAQPKGLGYNPNKPQPCKVKCSPPCPILLATVQSRQHSSREMYSPI